MKCMIAGVTVMAMLMTPAVSGRAAPEPDKTGISILEEVVVTGTRYEEKIAEVPANVSVITEDDIKNSPAYNVPDLLRTEAGIQVNDISGNRRTYKVDIRGFGETSQSNTLVLVDGRRINQADLSGTDWTLIPLARVARIEIIRGGRGAVLYGDNASGGVVNIITKEGEGFETGAEAAWGSYDTLRGAAFISGSEERLSYSLSGGYLNSDGYRDHSGTEAKDAGVNLGFILNDMIKLNFSSAYHKDSTDLPGSLKSSDFAAGASRTDTFSPDDYADTEDYFFAGGPEIYFFDNSLFKADISYRQRSFLSYATFSGGNYTGDTEIETVAFSPQVILRERVMGMANNLTAGIDFISSDETIINKSIFFGTPSEGRFNLKKKNFAYYVHDQLSPADSIAISGGYRHDRAVFEFDPSSPDEETLREDLFTVGATYDFLAGSQVYASLSRSFRYPVLDEMFNFFMSTIDTGLDPQTSEDYEIGVRHNFTDTLYGGLNLFLIDTDNEIFYNAATYTNENIDGRTRRQGLEISLTKKIQRLSLSGTYTYTDTKIKDGQYEDSTVPNVPRHKGTLVAKYAMGNGFEATLNGIYIGSRLFESDFANDFDEQGDYYLLNARIEYNRRNITAYLTVNNITNQEYSEYGVLGGFPVEEAYYPSPKINFLCGLAVKY